MNHAAMPWQAANIVRPLHEKSLFWRFTSADAEWKALMAEVHADMRRSPLAGAKYLLLFRSFLSALITDNELVTRIEQHLEETIRYEGPKEQGRLIP